MFVSDVIRAGIPQVMARRHRHVGRASYEPRKTDYPRIVSRSTSRAEVVRHGSLTRQESMLSPRSDTSDEDRQAFSFGVQIANEAMMRTLLLELVASAPPERRDSEIARIRDLAAKLTLSMLGAAEAAKDIETSAAADVIDNVFQDPLAGRWPSHALRVWCRTVYRTIAP